jgi:SAM-dependent methyltransferase
MEGSMMNDNTLKFLTEFYENEDEDEDARLYTRHGSVEFPTTVRYINKYLQSGMRILEVGAGTGRYAHHYARRGFEVDAVELVQHNINIFNANTQDGEQITVRQGNAIDLSEFADETYDITLVLGPLYHLFTEPDKLTALSEALRVTKRGGVVFVAYACPDSSIFQFGFMRNGLQYLFDRQILDPETFKARSEPQDRFELHRKEDIDALMSHFTVERLHYVATDLISAYIASVIDEFTDEMFDWFLKYHFTICERPDMVGITNHVLDIFLKI